MRIRGVTLCIFLMPISSYAETLPSQDTLVAKSPTVGCYYHDVLWDKTGYDKDDRPTDDFLALDICTAIAKGQKLKLFEDQLYAPRGLRIVRINCKLYFVRMRDLAEADIKVRTASRETQQLVTINTMPNQK